MPDARADSTTHFTFMNLNSEITEDRKDNFVVFARDANGNVDAGYRGTVQFSASAGSGAVPPDPYTFTEGDGGQKWGLEVTWGNQGVYTLSVTDAVSEITGSQAATVRSDAPTQMTFWNITDPITEGRTDDFAVDVKNAYGENSLQCTGTIKFASTDVAADLPDDYQFQPGDNVRQEFTLTWGTPDEQTLTVTDTANQALGGSRSEITVESDAAVSLRLSDVRDPVTEGRKDEVDVSARNKLGESSRTYRGTVHFTSSDPSATLPASTP